MLALGEMCFEGMGVGGKGVSRVGTWSNVFSGHGGSCKGGFTCWCWVKCVLPALGQMKRGFEVLALGEMCFRGMGAVVKGVSRVGTG